MGLFRGFDFGKGLERQLDAYKRLSPQQKAQRDPKLAKQVEKFAAQLEKEVSNPGSANPGLLKNAAEVIVEAAEVLSNPDVAYMLFAAMVARSRKVPVIPGLSGLVDRLIEVQTQQVTERVALMTWRITTGSMPPGRLYHYLHERAALTGTSDDWKSFATGVEQTIAKGTVKISDDMAIQALENLVNNKKQLGDQAADVLLSLAEAMFLKKKSVTMEQLLLEVAVSDGEHPPRLKVLIEKLLEFKQDASWELHQYNLTSSLREFAEHPIKWNLLLEKLIRGRRHKRDLIDFLLDNEHMPAQEETSRYLVELIMSESDVQLGSLIQRWQNAHLHASIPVSESALGLLREAVRGGRVSLELPEVQTPSRPPEELEPAKEPPPTQASETQKPEPVVTAEPDVTATEVEETPSVAVETPTETVGEALEPEVDLEAAEPVSLEEKVPDPEVEELTDETHIEEPIQEVSLEVEEKSPDPDVEEQTDETHIEEPIQEVSLEVEEKSPDPEIEEPSTPEPEDIEPELVVAPVEIAVEDVEPGLAGEVGESPEVETESTLEPLSTGESVGFEALVAGNDLGSFKAQIAQVIPDEVLADDSTRKVISELQGIEGKEWMGQEAILWIVSKLVAVGDIANAEQFLVQLVPLADQKVDALAKRVRSIFGLDGISETAEWFLTRMQLVGGDFGGFFEALQKERAGSKEHKEKLEALSEWLMQQANPSPEMLITLAQVQRDLMQDPQAGFQYASLASLKSPADAMIQDVMETWLEAMPAEEIHWHRGRQATFLLKTGGQPRLIRVVLNSVDAIIHAGSEASLKEPQHWLAEIRPMIDHSGVESQDKQSSKWARLYLTCVAHNGDPNELASALRVAREKLNPYEASVLANTVGDNIPAAAKFTLEFFSLMGSGEWEDAVSFVGRGVNEEVSQNLEISTLFEGIPRDAVKPLAWRLNELYILKGDRVKRLELLQVVNGQLESEDGDPVFRKELKAFFNQELSQLCKEEFEAAVRYRIEIGNGSQKPEDEASDLIVLTRQGDQFAQGQLKKLFDKHINQETPPEFVQDIAECLGLLYKSDQPDLSLIYYARAGLGMGKEAWAMAKVEEQNLVATSPDGLLLLGELSIHQQKIDYALKSIQALSDLGETTLALPVIAKLVELSPMLHEAQVLYLRLLVSATAVDYGLAKKILLDLSKLAHETGRQLPELLAPVLQIMNSLGTDDDLEQEATKAGANFFNLALYALAKDQPTVDRKLELIGAQESDVAEGLLEEFGQLDAEYSELPSMLIVVWCKTLFVAGKFDETLSRLTAIKGHKSDYPEYIALLEQLREAGLIPQANMQLGEAYLQLSLWQRATDTFSEAFLAQQDLAGQIFSQLNKASALEASPDKHALHVLGLKLVASSSKVADWEWAVSAIQWLESSWPIDDLLKHSQTIWEKFDKAEIEPNQQAALLHILVRLALTQQETDVAAGYLVEAYQLSGNVTPEVVEGLKGLNDEVEFADPELKLGFVKLQLAAAFESQNDGRVISAANRMARLSDRERQLALAGLGEYLGRAANPGSIQVARLLLLNPALPAEQKNFLEILDEASALKISQNDAKPIIQKVTALMLAGTEESELNQVLIQLLMQFGDESRAWQMACGFIGDHSKDGQYSLATLKKISEGEFATPQKEVVLSAMMLRDNHADAAKLICEADHHGWGEHAAAVASIAESLIHLNGAEPARAWLVDYYRSTDMVSLAADHVVWAKAAGVALETKWLTDDKSCEGLYRLAMLCEVDGEREQATEKLREARMAESIDPFISVAVRLRLADIFEEQDKIADALVFANEAVEIMAEHPVAQARAKQLELEVIHQKIRLASKQEDSPQRTLALAQLHRESGEHAEAIKELQEGIGRGQRSIAINVELAECFTETGSPAIARRAYNDAWEVIGEGEPNVAMSLRVLYGLSGVNARLGDIGEAIKNLEQLSMLQADYLDARIILNKLYQVQKAGGAGPTKEKSITIAPEAKPTTTVVGDNAEKTEAGSDTTQLVDDILSLFGSVNPEDGTSGEENPNGK